MKLLRTIAVTFAQYSRIPVPGFEWKEEDMKYSMSVFPWVGAVIGLVFVCVFRASVALNVPDFAACLLMTAVPLVITGGFHVDGFMDVSDSLSSYRSREEKLWILKDPHIGAFAVIRLGICGLIYIASLDIVISSGEPADAVLILAAGFFMSRSLSSLGVLNFRSARKEGMLFYEASCAGQGRKANNAACVLWLGASAAFMMHMSLIPGSAASAAAVLSFAWYKYKSYKEFGGITGDTAGYFVTVCETAMAAAAAAAVLIR